MPKRYRGTVRGGVVVLEPGAQLPEGTEVEVIECAAKPSEEAESAHEQLTRLLNEIHQAQQARGHVPPTPVEVETYLREVRGGWREREEDLP